MELIRPSIDVEMHQIKQTILKVVNSLLIRRVRVEPQAQSYYISISEILEASRIYYRVDYPTVDNLRLKALFEIPLDFIMSSFAEQGWLVAKTTTLDFFDPFPVKVFTFTKP